MKQLIYYVILLCFRRLVPRPRSTPTRRRHPQVSTGLPRGPTRPHPNNPAHTKLYQPTPNSTNPHLPKPTPRPNEHVRPRTEEEQRSGFANPVWRACFTPMQILCAQEPDGRLFGTTGTAFFALNEEALPATWSASDRFSPATEGGSISRRAGHSEAPAASGRRGSRKGALARVSAHDR